MRIINIIIQLSSSKIHIPYTCFWWWQLNYYVYYAQNNSVVFIKNTCMEYVFFIKTTQWNIIYIFYTVDSSKRHCWTNIITRIFNPNKSILYLNMKEINLKIFFACSNVTLQAFLFLCCSDLIRRAVMMFGQKEILTMWNKVNTCKRK